MLRHLVVGCSELLLPKVLGREISHHTHIALITVAEHLNAYRKSGSAANKSAGKGRAAQHSRNHPASRQHVSTP